jgi:long-subunit fatty acid transport protein
MIKKIIVSACLLLSLVSFAQEGTASPYSYYGIGDVRGTVENRSMAGVAVEQDSIHINLQNPASFANLKMTTLSEEHIIRRH